MGGGERRSGKERKEEENGFDLPLVYTIYIDSYDYWVHNEYE